MKTEELANLLNPNKLRILHAVYRCSEMNLCACDLVEKLDIPKSLLSYHIKSLRNVGFIEEVRCGRFRQYQVCKGRIKEIKQILELIEMI